MHGLPAKPEEVIPTIHAVVGQKIWDRFYPSKEREITQKHYVPTQIGMILRETLDRVRDQLDKAKDNKKSQETAISFFAKHSAEHAKKRRIADEEDDKNL